jgi:hypothetical protein
MLYVREDYDTSYLSPQKGGIECDVTRQKKREAHSARSAELRGWHGVNTESPNPMLPTLNNSYSKSPSSAI